MHIINLIDWIFLILTTALVALFLFSSIREKERRAILLAFLCLLGNGGGWIFFILFKQAKGVYYLNLAVLIGVALFVLLSLVKYFPPGKERDLSDIQKYDERDIMFVRNQLQYDPELAQKYYASHPGKRSMDKKIHARPELGEPGHRFYDAYFSPLFNAAFRYLHRTRDDSRVKISPGKKEIDTGKVTEIITAVARAYGAVDVGIVSLKPYHLYSHYGRQAENWGKELDVPHTFAIVIIVAMEVRMLKFAPALPVTLETSRQYVESAKIAHIIAEYIRGFGYNARAHTDGHYQVLCVPLAVSSGLGALGRMGIFIHPVYGPCVRISVVTTDLELVPTKANKHIDTIEVFCEKCKKCADNCPSQSIVHSEEPVSRGFRHWSIQQEKCFFYWKTIGTDCGVCIRVCPYTKPNTFIHRLIRYYISRNPLNQRLALFLDDLFYGRRLPIAS
ncbi:MAG: 4Fe-4S dicluster domain-containing protein [Acidobacteria bacterium]|jgi:reductive dehalogenase|nr:4Fe-4S dicluster domain-containing protein [Acidobacteriota bacterium]